MLLLPEPESDEGTFRTVVHYALWDASAGESRPIASVPGTEQFQIGDLPSYIVPYGRTSKRAVCGGRVFIGDTDHYSIARFSWEQGLDLIIRKRDLPLPLTREDRNAGKMEALNSPIFRAPLPPSVSETLRRGVDRLPFPPDHPSFTELLCDSEGLLWVALPAHSDSEVVAWDVFDQSGVPHSSVHLPAVLEVLYIGPDYILGVRRNELDVEFAELYRLDRNRMGGGRDQR